MRIKLTMFVLLLSALSLFANFTEPIDLEGDLPRFLTQPKVYAESNNVYFVYYDANQLKFSYSHDDGVNFGFTVVENSISEEDAKNANFVVLENGDIYIYFCKPIENNEIGTFLAISDDGGNSFTIDLLPHELSEIFDVAVDGDSLFIACGKINKNLSLYQYQYFTNNDTAHEEYPHIFWGQDELDGKVHSNSDIYVQQVGGGDNGGWPIFHEEVSTSGDFLYYPANIPLAQVAPMEDIFLGGYDTNVEEVIVNNPISYFIENSYIVPPNTEIAYLKMEGDSHQLMIGNIELLEIRPFTVYSWYPHNSEMVDNAILNSCNWYKNADSLWTNYIAIYDTIWTDMGNFSQNVFFMDCELWIEGEVTGDVKVGCDTNVKILGDITYTNTEIGELPDDIFEYNSTDYFSLFANGNIDVKYKHYDPNTNVLVDQNCDDIYLYGNYSALTFDESLSSCEKGKISNEYAHPHGSTPNFYGTSPNTGNDTLFTFIDFHKYIFPTNVEGIPDSISGFKLHSNSPPSGFPTDGYPYENSTYILSYPNSSNYVYPHGTDWPWYNPVWPESADDIVFERGTKHLYGTFSQSLFGITHNSGSSPYYHSADGNQWDVENHIMGGSHPSVGYEKDYHYDTRMETYPNPLVKYSANELLIVNCNLEGDVLSDSVYIPVYHLEQSEAMVVANDVYHIINIAYNNFHSNLYISQNGEDFEGPFFSDIAPIGNKIILNGDYLYYLINSTNQKLKRYDLQNHESEIIYQSSQILDFDFSNENELVVINRVDNRVNIKIIMEDGSIDSIYNDYFSQIILVTDASVKIDENNRINLFLQTNENAYYVSGSIDDFTPIDDEEILPVEKVEMSNYPNPFNPRTTISFNLLEDDDVNLSIFNIKGQKVKTLKKEKMEKGNHQVVWDGKDFSNKKVSSGSYFAKLIVGDRIVKKVKMTLLK